MNTKQTMVRLDKTLCTKLKKYKVAKGETYNEIIWRLLAYKELKQ